MPTPQERQALLFLAAIGLLGAGARAGRELSARERVTPAAERALAAQIATVAGKQQERAARQGRGRASGSATAGRGGSSSTGGAAAAGGGKGSATASPLEGRTIDVDRAPVSELQLLPRIGPALAARIVEDREANGPFGGLAGLQRVRGIGPAMARQLEPYVTFSGTPRPSSAARTQQWRAPPR